MFKPWKYHLDCRWLVIKTQVFVLKYCILKDPQVLWSDMKQAWIINFSTMSCLHALYSISKFLYSQGAETGKAVFAVEWNQWHN